MIHAEILKNEFNQQIGQQLPNWQGARLPSKIKKVGTYAIVEPLNPKIHADALFDQFRFEQSGWTYLPYGPFETLDDFYIWLDSVSQTQDPLFYVIIDKQKNIPVGLASYLRINPANGTIEVGHIHFSNQLKKTPIATEAMYLMMKNVFDELGYRRYEWKCDSFNLPSRTAAERLGFTFEGVFRQNIVYKNRNRDTAWFSIIDKEWPQLKSRFEKWLNPTNFDCDGKQIKSLREIV